MSKYGIGQPVLRFEDPRLLRGQGKFINDMNLHGQTYAVFVRSPHAHAKITKIDVEAAKTAPGVVAVLTGHDVKADGLGMPKANMPRKRPDGKPMYAPHRPPLVTDRVRYVGDPVVMVVADTLAEAKDAAELVEIDYESLPSVTLTEDTVKPGAPAVWDDCPRSAQRHQRIGQHHLSHRNGGSGRAIGNGIVSREVIGVEGPQRLYRDIEGTSADFAEPPAFVQQVHQFGRRRIEPAVAVEELSADGR